MSSANRVSAEIFVDLNWSECLSPRWVACYELDLQWGKFWSVFCLPVILREAKERS